MKDKRPPQIILDRTNQPQSMVCPLSRLVSLSFRMIPTETLEPGRIASFYGRDRKCLGFLALKDRKTLAFRRVAENGDSPSLEVELPGTNGGVDIACTLGPERDLLRANTRTAVSRARVKTPRIASIVFPSIRLQDESARGVTIENVSLVRSERAIETTQPPKHQATEGDEDIDLVECESQWRDSMKKAFARSGESQADLLFVGLFRDPGGYGKMNRSIVRGLIDLGVRVKAIEILHKKKSVLNASTAPWDVDFEVALAGNALQHPENWDLSCGVKRSFPPLIISGFFLGIDYGPLYHFYPGKVILLSMYEAQPLPQELVHICNRVDEVWVPGESNRKVFRESGVRKPIELLPLGVDQAFLSRSSPPAISLPFLELPQCRPAPVLPSFLFLFMGTILYHKGVDSLLRAFLEEFGPEEDVGLWCHSRLAYNFLPRLHKDVSSRVGRNQFPRVFLTNSTLPDLLLPALFHRASCYVSLSRGEGWDLPLMEAAACGLPVVGTDCLGHRDYLTNHNAFLVPVDGVQVALPDACGEAPLHSVHHGALLPAQGEEFIARARAALRDAFVKKAEANDRAERLQKTIETTYTWDKTAARVVERIEVAGEQPKALSGFDAILEEFEDARVRGDQGYFLLNGSSREVLDQAARIPRGFFKRLEAEGVRITLLVCTPEGARLRCLQKLLKHLAWLPQVTLVNPFESDARGLSPEALARELYEELTLSKIRVIDTARKRGLSSRVSSSEFDSNLLAETVLGASQPGVDSQGPPYVLSIIDASLEDFWSEETSEAYLAAVSCLAVEGSPVEHILARFDESSGSFLLGGGTDDDARPEEICLAELLDRAQAAAGVATLNAMVEPLLLLSGLPIVSACGTGPEAYALWDHQVSELGTYLGNERGIGPARRDLFHHAILREAEMASPDHTLLALVTLMRRSHVVTVDSRMLARHDEETRRLFMRSMGYLVPAHL